MSLNLAAVIFMGGYVLAIAAAALVMILRPGGTAIAFPPATRTAAQGTGIRDEIPLGGVAESFGIARGRVLAVLLRPDALRIQELALATGLGLVEDGHVPAEAILSADGETVQLAERWTEPPLDGTVSPAIALRRDMAVLTADRKRLGKLRLVCFEKDSGTVTDLVLDRRGSAPRLRLLPLQRVKAAGPRGIITELNAGEWATLAPFATDAALQQAILDRLAAEPAVQPFLRSLWVEVRDQQVRLLGYVRDRAAADRATHLAQSVPGVLRVDSGIVADEELAHAVIEALTRDRATAAARVQVRSRFGRVEIVGEAPDAATAPKIEQVAIRVPGVKSVRNLTTVR